MPNNTTTIKLLGIAGSLRTGAYTKAIIDSAKDSAKDKCEFTVFDLAAIPLYNQDIEDEGLPESVARFKEAIALADGLVIATPEYNYGISGVLKNAIDWASRPGYNSVLKDKPIVMMSSSPAFTGGVRAIGQLRQTLHACLSRVIAVPEIVIAEAHNKIKDGALNDETSLKYVRGGVDALIKEIHMIKSEQGPLKVGH